jgi:hypothetical protein
MWTNLNWLRKSVVIVALIYLTLFSTLLLQ